MPDIYTVADVYFDSREAVWHSSSCLLQAKQLGLIQANIGIEIGDVITNNAFSAVPLRHSPRTLFKSVGLAVQDLVFARYVISQEKRLCTDIPNNN